MTTWRNIQLEFRYKIQNFKPHIHMHICVYISKLIYIIYVHVCVLCFGVTKLVKDPREWELIRAIDSNNENQPEQVKSFYFIYLIYRFAFSCCPPNFLQCNFSYHFLLLTHAQLSLYIFPFHIIFSN